MAYGISVSIPCPDCGKRLEAAAEWVNQRFDQKVVLDCGHELTLQPNALRNPISAPSFNTPHLQSSMGSIGGGLFWMGVALMFWGSDDAGNIGKKILMLSLLAIFIAAALLPAASKLRYRRWIHSSQGRRYLEFERDLSSAKEALRKAQDSAWRATRLARHESNRRLLAEHSKKREYLLNLSPRAFEVHVATLFEALGYTVTLTPSSNDEGVDAYLEKNGQRAIVQCKRYTNGNVSRPEIQQAFGILNHEKAAEAFFVTTGGFSSHAVEFARDKPIHLVDLSMLIRMAEGAFTEAFVRSGPRGQMNSRLRRHRY